MTSIDYKKFYNRVGKRIGWDFSHIRKTEVGKAWDFFDEVAKKIEPQNVLLDIGTGGGEEVLKIAPSVSFVYGIDYSESMIATAKRNLKKLSYRNVKFLVMNSSNLKFPDNYFDVVTDRHCSFTAPEVYRVLKRGGPFLTQQVSEGDQLNIKRTFKRGQAYGVKDGTLKNEYIKQFKKAGFHKIKAYEYDSRVYYKTAKDYIFHLRYTPTIPDFGKRGEDFKILEKFIEKNTTPKGIKTNSKRFMITAVKR